MGAVTIYLYVLSLSILFKLYNNQVPTQWYYSIHNSQSGYWMTTLWKQLHDFKLGCQFSKTFLYSIEFKKTVSVLWSWQIFMKISISWSGYGIVYIITLQDLNLIHIVL